MTDGQSFLAFAELASLWILSFSFLLASFRVLRGPGLPDRILGLDMLVMIAIGFIVVFGIRTGYVLYLDIAIALGLVGFLATVAFARFVLSQRYQEEFVSEDPLHLFVENKDD